MRTRVDARFLEEARSYELRFCCEDCTAFDEVEAACAYGYPTAPHRRLPLTESSEIVFCKAFEVR